MGAEALVGVPPDQIVGQKAPPGIGNAHRPVHEHFDLKIFRDSLLKLPDLRKGELPGGHDPLRPELVPEAAGPVVGRVCLRADVEIDLRHDSARKGEHARVRDEDRIGFHFPKFLKIRLRLIKVPVMGKDIGGHVHLYAPLMGKRDALLHLLRREIVGLSPKPEGLPSDVDRIRPVEDRDLQDVKAPRGYQKFRMFHTAPPKKAAASAAARYIQSFTLTARPSPAGRIVVTRLSSWVIAQRYSRMRL